jgi:hypothetical protein
MWILLMLQWSTKGTLIDAFGLHMNNMKTKTLVHRSRLNEEEKCVNCYTVLKGAPQIGKLSTISHFQHVFLSNCYLMGIMHYKKVCERQLVS